MNIEITTQDPKLPVFGDLEIGTWFTIGSALFCKINMGFDSNAIEVKPEGTYHTYVPVYEADFHVVPHQRISIQVNL